MKFPRNQFKIIFLCICVLLHGFALATTHHKKKARKHHRAKHRTHAAQPLLRPDLKLVSSVAKPVFMGAPILATTRKLKVSDKSRQLTAFVDPRESLFNNEVPLTTKIPQINWPEIESKMYTKNGKVYAKYNDLTLLLTINPHIQESTERFLNQGHGIVSGSTAIIEPKTGRLLALAQGGNKGDATTSVSSRGPAASLIKIVTSAAAIEKEGLDPSYELSFRGGCSTLNHENWIENPERDNLKLHFDKAFGSSCNTFFARLALYHVGLASLKEYAEKFMFNRPIPSDIKIQTSLFLLPDAETAIPQEIAEAGSGFGATKLSPIHAALLSATIANNGIMMAPYVIEAAYDQNNREIYRAKPMQIGRVVSEETADKIATLMFATTSVGTSRRVFHKRGTRGNVDEIAGKTGTLLDLEDRKLLYTWFSGIAFSNSDRNIAIGTVVASPQNYIVRASAIAQTTIAEYYRSQKRDQEND